MIHRGTGVRLSARAAGLVFLLGPLVGLAGCLPRLNRSGEPVQVLPSYVTSVKYDPRTLKPIEEEAPAGEKPGAP